MIDQDIKCIALIPARFGSKRVPNKNIKKLNCKPLIAYTIMAALSSNVFSRVIVSTDSEKIKAIAEQYGAEVPVLRPSEYAGDTSPDIEWINHLLSELIKQGETAQCFSILRPTSPFRQSETIKRAWQEFLSDGKADSLRAIEKTKLHPAKMWQVKDNRMTPVMQNLDKSSTPWHSMQYQSLPEIYVQNASLEIAWVKTVTEKNSIAGEEIMPFITENYEGFDINNQEDWVIAEHLIENNLAELPK